MKKNIFLFLVVLFVIFNLTMPLSTLADGMVFNAEPGRFDYGDEVDQQALISYENGWEKMILSIGIPATTSSNSVWLFPLPAEPEQIALDILAEVPTLHGENIAFGARNYLNWARDYLLGTQVYTILPLMLWNFNKQSYNLGATSNGGTRLQGVDSAWKGDVEVFEHLEKEGLVTEIITAKTADGLSAYLKAKGLDINLNSIPVLNNYIGKNYSFVVSWLGDSTKTVVDAVPSTEIFIDQRFRGLDYILPLFVSTTSPGPSLLFAELAKHFSDLDYFSSHQNDFAGYVKKNIRAEEVVKIFLQDNYPDLYFNDYRTIERPATGSSSPGTQRVVTSHERSFKAVLENLPKELVEQAIEYFDGRVPALKSYLQENIGYEMNYYDYLINHYELYGYMNDFIRARRPDLFVFEKVTYKPYVLQVATQSNARKGVYVNFKTDKIFFPLLPTSVYGSKKVPASIRVIGHVKPELYDNIKNFAQVEYFYAGRLSTNNSENTFYNRDNGKIKYTKIDLNPPSKFLTADLWINGNVEPSVSFTGFLADRSWGFTFLWLLFLSGLTGLLVGPLVYRELRSPYGVFKSALFGLWNLTTLIGLFVASFYLRENNAKTEITGLLEAIKIKGYVQKKHKALFLFIIGIPWLILAMVLLYSLFMTLGDIASLKDVFYSSVTLVLFLVVVIPPIPILWLAKRYTKISPDDLSVFANLKAAGYSTLTLKDTRQLKYIAYYSLVFCLLTIVTYWLLTLPLLAESNNILR